MTRLGRGSDRNPMRKGLHVLRFMAEAPSREWGVRELAQAAGMAPSTVQRVLRTLLQEGLAQQGSSRGQYQLGLDFLRLAYQATANQPYRRVARPVMRRLVAACNESALLGMYNHARACNTCSWQAVDSTHPLRYVVELNEWLPVYASAGGLAIMAFLPADQRRAIIRLTKLKPITDRTIRDPQRLEAELESIQARGYACTAGRRIPGAVGIAAPIRAPRGQVTGCLALTIPAQRFEPSREAVLGRLILEHANQITESLGGQPVSHEAMEPKLPTRSAGTVVR